MNKKTKVVAVVISVLMTCIACMAIKIHYMNKTLDAYRAYHDTAVLTEYLNKEIGDYGNWKLYTDNAPYEYELYWSMSPETTDGEVKDWIVIDEKFKFDGNIDTWNEEDLIEARVFKNGIPVEGNRVESGLIELEW